MPPQEKLSQYFSKKYNQDPPKNDSSQKPSSIEEKKFVKTMMYGLTAPIVFGSSQWASSFPQDMIERARMMRLAKSIECMDQEMCTYLDCVAFFYPLSMDAPLRHEYVKMYMYCYKHGLPDKWKIMTDGDPDIERMTELHENEHEELRGIRRKIFRRQMSMIK